MIAMRFTKRNHYNPCFWTAHWNPGFLSSVLDRKVNFSEARTQQVYALSVKSNKVFRTTVENVHFDKHLGVAEISPEDAKDFCRRNFPDRHDQFCEDMKNRPETLYLDFEDVLTGLEATPAYQTLLKVIARQRIDGPMDRGFLAGFVLLHHLRSHAILNSMIEFHGELGIKKFEYFWMLKHFLSNTESCFALVMTFAMGYWKFYRMYEDTFPLNDSPILVYPESIMVALSPRLLLEIDRTRPCPHQEYAVTNYISSAKLDEFRRRTINNTFREIIFGHSSLLEQWQSSTEFAERHALMSNVSRYNAVVEQRGSRELWKINAYGGSG